MSEEDNDYLCFVKIMENDQKFTYKAFMVVDASKPVDVDLLYEKAGI